MDNQVDIFQRMLRGDEKALEYLLKEHYKYLMSVGLKYLRDRQRVEDVIHDLFADLWNKKSEIQIKYGVKSFLRGAVVKKCLAVYKKERRMDSVMNSEIELRDPTPSPDHFIDRDSLKAVVDDVVNGLPAKCKRVFMMSRYEGKNHREISEELGISKKTVENHMARALKELRQVLLKKNLLALFLLILKSSVFLGVVIFLTNTL